MRTLEKLASGELQCPDARWIDLDADHCAGPGCQFDREHAEPRSNLDHLIRFS